MSATPEQIKTLGAPTPADEIGTRPAMGSSGGLSYIDARFVAQRFDDAVGPENWQVDIVWSDELSKDAKLTKAGKAMDGTEAHGRFPMARIGVSTDAGWVWKMDIGDFSDISSVKGGVSDAIKRAAVQWGVGRDLYPKPADKNKPAVRQKRKATTKAEAKPAIAQAAENAVVGQSGLTGPEKAQLFEALKSAGVPNDKRKDLVHTITGKTKTTDMTADDLELVLAFAENGEYSEHPAETPRLSNNFTRALAASAVT